MSLKNYPNILKLAQSLDFNNKADVFEFLNFHARGLENPQNLASTILEDSMDSAYANISTKELIDLFVLSAAQNIQNEPDFEKVATRLTLTKLYVDIFHEISDLSFDEMYKNAFYNYISYGIEQKLLDPNIATTYDLEACANALNKDNDDDFSYIGIQTLQNRYMLKSREQKWIETPQFAWMRVAMGMAIKEKNATEIALKFYQKLSEGKYIPGGSTIIGAGTQNPVLSNCYLLDTEDDIKHIFDNVKNVALISKATGGIGLSLTKLRAEGSPIHSNNTFSSGPIPFAHVIDSTIRAVSRAGKKMGALALYMENWHYNFPEFLDLRQNAGDDYRRTRTANTAVYISDEFMKRVINGDEWYLFDPAEVKDLPELYGAAFSRRYNEYVEMAKKGEIKMFKTIPAREQMKKILSSLQATAHPWLTWKDTINVRALNNNTGTIHCSNLCTEVCLPQDKNNIAVCNLLYVNIVKHLEKENGKTIINWKGLEETVRLGMRHLDNLVDVNNLTVPEAKNSDEKNRAVGLGILGFSEILENFGFAYDSQDAYELMDKIMEFVSYVTIDESAELAKTKGAYPNFEGSLWSKGMVPYDTVKRVNKERNWENHEDAENDPITTVKNLLKDVDLNNEGYSKILEVVERVKNENDSLKEKDYKHKLEQDTTIRLNWDKLREKVKRGMRNATTMMIAPNASTGLVASTTPGIDPRFAQMFSRSTNNGKFLDINKNMVNDLKKLGLWEKVREEVLRNYGDISTIEEVPENLKEIYKTSFQIDPEAFIEVASRAQKWIDQSMSRNMYLETRDVDEMMNVYIKAWQKGLKTTYYLHIKPRHKAEQSSIKVNKAKDLNKAGFNSMLKKQVQSDEKNAEPVKKGFGVAKTGFGVLKRNELDTLKKEINDLKQVGAVKNEKKIQENGDVKEINNSESLPVSKTGFGRLNLHKKPELSLSTVNNSQEKKGKAEEINKPFACPTDPMERALCEGCQ